MATEAAVKGGGPAPARPTMARLRRMDREPFTALLGGVVEHAPWVARAAWERGPFTDLDGLHGAMAEAIEAATPEVRLGLIRAHPELAGKAAIGGELTASSRLEQASSGLDRCTPAQYARLQELNAAYKARFGFPFVMAVRRSTVPEILERFERRLGNAPDEEEVRAVREILVIARLRLEALVQG